MAGTAAEELNEALQAIAAGGSRTRPVSVSLPGGLVDALQRLVAEGQLESTSAAATEALTRWAYNRLLRLTLDELYDEHPDVRPDAAAVRAMADRLDVALPAGARDVA